MERREHELLELTLLESLKKLLDKTLYYSHRENIELESDIEHYIVDNNNSRKNIYSIISEVIKERSEEETLELIDKINVKVSAFEANRIKDYLMNSEFSIFKDDIDRFISSIENKFSEVEKSLENNDNTTTVVIETTSVVLPEEDSEEEQGNTTRLLKIIDERIETLEKEALSNEDNVEINFFKKEETPLEQPTENDLNNLFDPFKVDLAEEVVKEEKEELFPPKEEDIEQKVDAFEFSKEMADMQSKLSREEIDGFIKKIDDKLAELEKEEKALDVTRFDIPIQ